jgi:hypothetical protein
MWCAIGLQLRLLAELSVAQAAPAADASTPAPLRRAGRFGAQPLPVVRRAPARQRLS